MGVGHWVCERTRLCGENYLRLGIFGVKVPCQKKSFKYATVCQILYLLWDTCSKEPHCLLGLLQSVDSVVASAQSCCPGDGKWPKKHTPFSPFLDLML